MQAKSDLVQLRLMPVAVVARETRSVETEHKARVTEPDLGDELSGSQSVRRCPLKPEQEQRLGRKPSPPTEDGPKVVGPGQHRRQSQHQHSRQTILTPLAAAPIRGLQKPIQRLCAEPVCAVMRSLRTPFRKRLGSPAHGAPTLPSTDPFC